MAVIRPIPEFAPVMTTLFDTCTLLDTGASATPLCALPMGSEGHTPRGRKSERPDLSGGNVRAGADHLPSHRPLEIRGCLVDPAAGRGPARAQPGRAGAGKHSAAALRGLFRLRAGPPDGSATVG